ncbi:unnamed protein product [marine sediment metagenome]|uniref:Tyrosine specific protein phosphatases domain-containing protein n=1 Tax=marine sediment metagenome TaxID=412755 RepID=X1A3R3_9ZZZZ
MMKFAVLSRAEIKDFKTDKKHIVISVMDPNDSEGRAKMLDNKKREGVLWMAFHDWNGRQMKMIKDKPVPNERDWVFFDSKMAKLIVDFVQCHQMEADLVVCQCEAGISRSAGIAAALAKCINGNDFYFFNRYLPNSLVYSLIMKEWNKQ